VIEGCVATGGDWGGCTLDDFAARSERYRSDSVALVRKEKKYFEYVRPCNFSWE
jgi:hypothetical protein